MAVRVPPTTRVCLNCKLNSIGNAEKEFHEIFDEVGLELQLPFLVKTFFHIDLDKKDKQHLCDDCVNRLIELYDMDEHTKDASCNTNNLKNETELSHNEESSENVHKAFVINSNNTQVILTKSNIECKNFETFASTQEENAIKMHKQSKSEDKGRSEYENIKDMGYFFNENRSVPFTQQQNQKRNAIADDFVQTGERKCSQDFNISLSSSAIKDYNKLDELESSELMEFISDDENQKVVMNKQSNSNIQVSSKKLEKEKYQKSSNEKIEVLSEIKSETEESIFLDSDQNEFIDESECEEFINIDDSNSLLEELEITKERKALLLNASSNATHFNNIEHFDGKNCWEQADISDDITFQEEYLLEEIIWSEEYDQVDLNEYLDKVLITNFQDFLLNWKVECKLCLEKYNSFGKLLNHGCITELEKEQQLSCIIKDCEDRAKDLPALARHLVLKHYDNLESIAIFGKCQDCQKIYSNVLDFNMHSCCRNIKRKIDVQIYNCKYCDLDFPSFKRYVFHMQFHLKSHRPKVCILCGELFKNSNDFFEHTQYKHDPKTALACIRCDRYFQQIKSLNKHMKMHDDSKYLYECTRCPRKYIKEQSLNQHMVTFHNINPIGDLVCEYCPREFVNKSSYDNHIKSHDTDTGVETFICSTCGLLTNNMEMMKEHIESDNNSPCFSSLVQKKILGLGYVCENCSLCFYTITNLKDHRLSESHSGDLFRCGKCRKGFNTISHVHLHYFNHDECRAWQKSFPITRYFVCNIGDCQEFTPIWESLHRHKKRFHSTEEETNSPRVFECRFCQKLYSSKKSLHMHVVQSHNNEAIKCPHCKKNLRSINILQMHIDNYHTPVKCDICLKTFKRKLLLRRHIECVHNNAKRYFCKYCQEGAFNKRQIEEHEQKVHPQL